MARVVEWLKKLKELNRGRDPRNCFELHPGVFFELRVGYGFWRYSLTQLRIKGREIAPLTLRLPRTTVASKNRTMNFKT